MPEMTAGMPSSWSSGSPRSSKKPKGGEDEDENELRVIVNSLRDEVLQLQQDVRDLRAQQQQQQQQQQGDSGSAFSSPTPNQATMAQVPTFRAPVRVLVCIMQPINSSAQSRPSVSDVAIVWPVPAC